MKQRLKQITKYIVIFALVTLSSCEKDLYDDIVYSNDIILRQVSMKDLKNPCINQKIIAKIENLKFKKEHSKKVSCGRMVYDSINDFYFDDEKAIYLEKDGHHSYTFEVFRNNNVGKLENLIFNSKGNGEYDVYYVKYEFTKEEFQNLTLDEFRNSATKYYPLDAEGWIVVTQWICFEEFEYRYVSTQPQGGIPTQQPLFSWQWVSTGTTCTMLVQGGNNGGGYDGNSTNAGTNNGSNTGPNSGGGGANPSIITVPSGCLLCPTIVDNHNTNPCEKVNNLKNDTKFQQKMNDLSYAAKNYKFEKVYSVYDNPNPINTATTIDNYNFFPFSGNVYNPTATYNYFTNIKGLIHSHYKDLYSIFSSPDLQDLYNILLNPSITSDFFYGVVTEDGTSYIITISDRTKFINFGNEHLSNYEDFKEFEKDIFNKKYNIKPDNSVATNELGFLKMMSELDIGLNFYSGNEDRTEWEKKVYNPITNQVSPTNCN